MGFLNRFLLLYAVIVFILTGVYYYVAANFLVDSKGDSNILLLVGYMLLIFASTILISRKDHSNTFSGFTYHFTTYLIVVGSMAALVFFGSTEATRTNNLHALLVLMAVWGTGLLFHLGMYLFMFRKKQIRNYEKDDVFQ